MVDWSIDYFHRLTNKGLPENLLDIVVAHPDTSVRYSGADQLGCIGPMNAVKVSHAIGPELAVELDPARAENAFRRAGMRLHIIDMEFSSWRRCVGLTDGDGIFAGHSSVLDDGELAFGEADHDPRIHVDVGYRAALRSTVVQPHRDENGRCGRGNSEEQHASSHKTK